MHDSVSLRMYADEYLVAYEPQPGETIEDVAREMVRLAREQGKTVSSRFNNVSLVADRHGRIDEDIITRIYRKSRESSAVSMRKAA